MLEHYWPSTCEQSALSNNFDTKCCTEMSGVVAGDNTQRKCIHLGFYLQELTINDGGAAIMDHCKDAGAICTYQGNVNVGHGTVGDGQNTNIKTINA